MLDIEEIFIKRVQLVEDFNYKSLYNDDTRGAVNKNVHKTLLSSTISEGLVTVEKFIVAEDIHEELYEIIDESKSLEFSLIDNLKEYYDESAFVVAPLIYLLKQIDPNYSLDNENGTIRRILHYLQPMILLKI